MQWLISFLQGSTLKQIAKTTGHATDTVSRGVNRAAEAMVEQAQATLMQEMFPLAAELWKEMIRAEIAKAKKGEKADFTLIDRLFKGMSILDQKPIAQAQPQGQLPPGEGVETLAAIFASRPAPPRIGDTPSVKELPSTEGAIDVESEEAPDERSGQ